MLRVILSSDDAIDLNKFFSVIESHEKTVFVEAFISSDKRSLKLDRFNIPKQYQKEVSRIFESFNKHLILKVEDKDLADKLISVTSHIYTFK